MKKRHFRLFRTAVTLVFALCLLAADLAPALAVTQADIDALKKDAASLDSKKKELESQLDALADDKAEVLQRRKLLDQQVANTSAQIQNLESQISEYSALITQSEEELAETERQEAEQYELFCKRVRAMEEQGTVDYWSVLFRANSFGDLLSRLDAVNEIMEYDQRVIAQLKALQAEIEEKKASLEESKSQTESAKGELVAKKKELDAQRQQAIALIQEIQSNENQYESALSALDAEEERIQANIVKLSRELAAQQAAQGKPTQSSSGGYIWPVDSRYITSTVGGRTSPGGVGSTNHKGIDIAGRYGTPIYAADGGTVTYSGWMGGYGYTIRIDHGNGKVTYYAHNSSLIASVGQHVYKGQQIARMGSTGNSTGNHCHFEVRINGVAKNPLNYLP